MTDRCEAEDKTKLWPYTKRCMNVARYLNTYIKPLDREMDLCRDHISSYINTLSFEDAEKLVEKTGFI